MKKIFTLKLAGTLILLATVAALVLQNTESVETNFLWASVSMPRAMLLALVFAFGLVVGLILPRFVRTREEKKKARAKAEQDA